MWQLLRPKAMRQTGSDDSTNKRKSLIGEPPGSVPKASVPNGPSIKKKRKTNLSSHETDPKFSRNASTISKRNTHISTLGSRNKKFDPQKTLPKPNKWTPGHVSRLTNLEVNDTESVASTNSRGTRLSLLQSAGRARAGSLLDSPSKERIKSNRFLMQIAQEKGIAVDEKESTAAQTKGSRMSVKDLTKKLNNQKIEDMSSSSLQTSFETMIATKKGASPVLAKPSPVVSKTKQLAAKFDKQATVPRNPVRRSQNSLALSRYIKRLQESDATEDDIDSIGADVINQKLADLENNLEQKRKSLRKTKNIYSRTLGHTRNKTGNRPKMLEIPIPSSSKVFEATIEEQIESEKMKQKNPIRQFLSKLKHSKPLGNPGKKLSMNKSAHERGKLEAPPSPVIKPIDLPARNEKPLNPGKKFVPPRNVPRRAPDLSMPKEAPVAKKLEPVERIAEPKKDVGSEKPAELPNNAVSSSEKTENAKPKEIVYTRPDMPEYRVGSSGRSDIDDTSLVEMFAADESASALDVGKGSSVKESPRDSIFDKSIPVHQSNEKLSARDVSPSEKAVELKKGADEAVSKLKIRHQKSHREKKNSMGNQPLMAPNQTNQLKYAPTGTTVGRMEVAFSRNTSIFDESTVITSGLTSGIVGSPDSALDSESRLDSNSKLTHKASMAANRREMTTNDRVQKLMRNPRINTKRVNTGSVGPMRYSAARSNLSYRTTATMQTTRSTAVQSTLGAFLDPLSYRYEPKGAEMIEDVQDNCLEVFCCDIWASWRRFRAPGQVRTLKQFEAVYGEPPEQAIENDALVHLKYVKERAQPLSYGTIEMLAQASKFVDVQFSPVWIKVRGIIENRLSQQVKKLKKEGFTNLEKVSYLQNSVICMEDLHKIDCQVKGRFFKRCGKFIKLYLESNDNPFNSKIAADQTNRYLYKLIKGLRKRVSKIRRKEDLIRSGNVAMILTEEPRWACQICDDPKGEHTRYQRRLPNCGHIFHKKCLDDFLENHYECKICHEDVEVMDNPMVEMLTSSEKIKKFIFEFLYYALFLFPLIGVLFGAAIGGAGIFLDVIAGRTIEMEDSSSQGDDNVGEGTDSIRLVNRVNFFKCVLASYAVSFCVFGGLVQSYSLFKFFGTPAYTNDIWLILPVAFGLAWAPFTFLALAGAFDVVNSGDSLDALSEIWKAFAFSIALYLLFVLTNHFLVKNLISCMKRCMYNFKDDIAAARTCLDFVHILPWYCFCGPLYFCLPENGEFEVSTVHSSENEGDFEIDIPNAGSLMFQNTRIDEETVRDGMQSEQESDKDFPKSTWNVNEMAAAPTGISGMSATINDGDSDSESTEFEDYAEETFTSPRNSLTRGASSGEDMTI